MNKLIYLAAMMLVDNFPDATVRFFVKVYPSIVNNPKFSCSDLAEIYGYTPEAARQHVKVLTNKGYLKRISYRSWVVEPKIIHRVEKGFSDEAIKTIA